MDPNGTRKHNGHLLGQCPECVDDADGWTLGFSSPDAILAAMGIAPSSFGVQESSEQRGSGCFLELLQPSLPSEGMRDPNDVFGYPEPSVFNDMWPSDPNPWFPVVSRDSMVMSNTPIRGGGSHEAERSSVTPNTPIMDAPPQHTADGFATIPASSPLTTPPRSPALPPTTRRSALENRKRKQESEESKEISPPSPRTRYRTRLAARKEDPQPVASSSRVRLEHVPPAARAPPKKHHQKRKASGSALSQESRGKKNVLRPLPSATNAAPPAKRRRIASSSSLTETAALPPVARLDSDESEPIQPVRYNKNTSRQSEELYRLFRIYRGTHSPRCGINGCQEVLRWDTHSEFDHARRHLEGTHFGLQAGVPQQARTWRCSVNGCHCTTAYTDMRSLTRHHEEKHLGWAFRCPGCGGPFKRFKLVQKHYEHSKKHDGERRWTAAVHAVIKAGDRYAWPGDENAEEAEEEEERDEEDDEA